MLEMNTGTVDLNLLRVFLAIWETNSLTVAADRLALSQPAVSHCLRRLRDLFQDPLFVRTAEGMQPTAAAIRLHGPIDRALDLINGAMQQHAGFDAASSTRRFRISMSDMSEFYFLPPLLAALQQSAPGVGLDIVQVPLHQVEGGMRSGDIDFAIGYVPGLSADCVSQTLFHDEHVCMVRAGHPLARRALTKERLGELRYVFASSNATGHGLIEKWFGELDIKRNIVLHSPHFTVVPEIVRGTDLAVVFPRSIAERFNRGRAYRLLPLPFALPPIEVKLHWHQRFASDAGMAWLRETIGQMFCGQRTA
ncbi:LysR family transcriptional regulator [Pseudoduganella namucuonensis]|uniref:Transcriptional regulator, LysR family n=1 Tax=Pseudoduganella namucuonensis TaxID=1035707 RepID=A0A1I7LP04_9BURK|nr:LysR family transcriptional regulator [Pseudoduganella namucuonensis]SFV11447.1 transcriptional regulator, LysR family [Pseudoduganella namucuonensis]